MSLTVKYVDAPLGAQEKAVVTATEAQPFCKTEQLTTLAADVPWVTMEEDAWTLDGTGRILPDAPQRMGWWSQTPTDGNGKFAQPPVITVRFPQVYTASGLTFRFWPALNQWCSEVEVSWYREDVLLAQTTAYPAAADWAISHWVENFDQVTIRLLATNCPHRFAKLQHLQIGQMLVFFRDEIVQVRLLNEVDPSSCTLSVDTMTVQIRERYGRILQPQKNQAIHLYRDGVQLAAHYITDSQRHSRDDYTFRCQSAVGRLEDVFMGGIYREYPVRTLLQEVLGNFSFKLAKELTGKTVTGYLSICTRRQALQQIAFAIGAVVSTQGDGTIYLQLPDESVSGRFYAENIFAGAELRQEAQVAGVELLVHSYTPGDEERTLLKDAEIRGENVLLTFSQPYHTYRITGGVLTASGANWVRVTADGSVTLTAKNYNHTTVVHRKEMPGAMDTELDNMVRVEKATLIHAGNAQEALERVYAYSILQAQLRQQVVVKDQRAGQWVESLSPWDGRVIGYIAGMESTFTDGGQCAQIEIRGREVTE